MLRIAAKQLLTKICISFFEIFVSSRSGGRPVDSVRMLLGRFFKTVGTYSGESWQGRRPEGMLLRGIDKEGGESGGRAKARSSVFRRVESW